MMQSLRNRSSGRSRCRSRKDSKRPHRVGRPRALRLLPNEEPACLEGLYLLERLANAGQWVPISVIQGYLRRSPGIERARALLLAKVARLEHSTAVLEQVGASLCERDRFLGTLLHKAVFEKNFPRVKFLLEFEPSLLKVLKTDGSSPIHVAAEAAYADIDILQLLIDTEKDTSGPYAGLRDSCRSLNGPSRVRRHIQTGINARDAVGQTPIFLAAAFGDPASVRMLASAGADVECMRLLDGWRPLHAASERGCRSCVKELVKAGATVDQPAPDGSTPLQLAVSNDEKDSTMALLELGADPNAEDADGWTPLHKAAAVGDAELVEMLVEAGADQNIRTDDGKTALELARTDLVRRILTG